MKRGACEDKWGKKRLQQGNQSLDGHGAGLDLVLRDCLASSLATYSPLWIHSAEEQSFLPGCKDLADKSVSLGGGGQGGRVQKSPSRRNTPCWLFRPHSPEAGCVGECKNLTDEKVDLYNDFLKQFKNKY